MQCSNITLRYSTYIRTIRTIHTYIMFVWIYLYVYVYMYMYIHLYTYRYTMIHIQIRYKAGLTEAWTMATRTTNTTMFRPCFIQKVGT